MHVPIYIRSICNYLMMDIDMCPCNFYLFLCQSVSKYHSIFFWLLYVGSMEIQDSTSSISMIGTIVSV